MKKEKKITSPFVRTSVPGAKSKRLIRKYSTYFGKIRLPRMAVKKAYACTIEDMDGNKFLSFAQSACVTGYSTPEVVKASIKQTKKMIIRGEASPSLLNFTSTLLNKLPEELSKGRVNYVASGTESVELATSIVRSYTEKPLILSYHYSHHGFIGTPFQLSGDPRIKKSWRAKISDVLYIPYPMCYRCFSGRQYPDCNLICLTYMENVINNLAIPDQTAGLIIEPILVNGGVHVPPDKYMKEVVNLCKKNNIKLIFDEIYTGVGKTGKFLAAEHWNITPDLVCLGKSIGGGFPLAVVVTKREITDKARGGARFTGSFAGNLVSCAAGSATMKYIEKHHLNENAEKMGNYLIRAFKDFSKTKSSIGDVRGKGLLIGIELVNDKNIKKPASKYASQIVKKAFDKGLIIKQVGPYRNVLLIAPPLIINSEHANKAIEILDQLID